jgi:hypothetical protein
MAVGDAVVGWASKTNNSTTDITPGSGAEWFIHTLMSAPGKSMEVYLTEDGSTFTLLDTLTGGAVHALTFRLTNTIWMRLKNVSGGTAYNGYEGVVTK